MISGTATVQLVPGGGLEGTAVCDTSSLTPAFYGTATVDYSTIAPWLVSDRRTTVRILVNGEDIIGLLGDVEIDNNTSTIPSTATFMIADPRACLMASDSIIRGAQPIQILLSCDDGNGPQTWVAFSGIIESVSNEDPYLPRATVKAISVSAEIFVYNAAGCVRAVPFGGYTRAQLLQAYALAVGFALDMSGVPSSTIVRQPVDISGVSIESLLFRFGELEGWYCRETAAGELEILTEAEVLGAAPKWDLTEDGYLSLREDSPNRPTTVLTIGGSQITTADQGYEAPETFTSVDSATDVFGNVSETTTENTYQYGVLLGSVVTTRATYASKGITVLDASYQIVSRVTDQYTYGMTIIVRPPTSTPGVGMTYYETISVPTSQLLSTTHTTEGFYSPLDAIGPGVVWTDGTHHTDDYETFRMTGQVVSTQTYSGVDDPIPCRLMSKVTTTSGYYSPQSLQSISGNVAISQGGTPGAASYLYQLVFYDVNSRSIGVTNVTETTTGNAALSGANYNILTPSFPGGAAYWQVYRFAFGGKLVISFPMPVATTTFDDIGGNFGGSDNSLGQFDDKTFRAGAYAWVETERIEETYSDNLAAVEAGTTGERQNKTNRIHYAWIVPWLLAPPYPNETAEIYGVDYAYSEIQAGIPNATYYWLTKSQKNHDGSSTYSRDWTSGTISDPITVAATVPQYSQTAMSYTLAASTDTYPLVTRTETIQDAENLVELERAVRRRMRSELGFRLTVSLPAVSFLNVWDTIAVWDSIRGYVGTVGWVESIRPKISALNGWFGQEITIVIPPEGL